MEPPFEGPGKGRGIEDDDVAVLIERHAHVEEGGFQGLRLGRPQDGRGGRVLVEQWEHQVGARDRDCCRHQDPRFAPAPVTRPPQALPPSSDHIGSLSAPYTAENTLP